MTDIQSRTWEPALSGIDVTGKARTGTGKTLAFLLPAMQRIITSAGLEDTPNDRVRVLVISPTRELAQQTYQQVQSLLDGSRTAKQANRAEIEPLSLSGQVMFGGNPKWKEVENLEHKIPEILVATPGRLVDHCKATDVRNYLGNVGPFASLVENIDVLVLDEMDRLLGMGFRDDILEIVSFLNENRQTLLFSATAPAEVEHMISRCVKDNHQFIDCNAEEEDAVHPGDMVQQSHIVVSADRCVGGVIQIVKKLMQQNEKHKIIVFFPTTAQVSYFAELFRVGLGIHVLSLHSKMKQSLRTTTSERFRMMTKSAVLFSSDVSARGVDYPDVTHVVQVGAASDRETYVHRLGRTGRAGKSGEGILMLSSNERAVLKTELQDFDIPVHQQFQSIVNGRQSAYVESELMRIAYEIRNGQQESIAKRAKEAYLSLLGFYYGRLRSLGATSEDALVEQVNAFAAQSGLDSLPVLSRAQAERYGLQDHRGINVRTRWTAGSSFDVLGGETVDTPYLSKPASRKKIVRKRQGWGKARRNSEKGKLK